MDTGLYRSTLKSGSPICGYYKYLDVFQIIKSKENDDSIHEYFIDIEYNKNYTHRKNIDTRDNLDRSHLDLLKEIVSLLSIVTNDYYEFDEHPNMPRPCSIDEFSDVSSTLEIRKDVNRVTQRQNYTCSFVSIHPEADKFFENYFKLPPDVRFRYNTSIFIYQNMRKIIFYSASMGIVGLISAIENLMALESNKDKEQKKCENCSQPIYSISRRFKDFMLEFSEFDVKDRNKLLNKFYSRRSKISHAGEILEIDRLISRFSMKELEEFTEIESHVRIALFNYLLKYDSVVKKV